MYHGGLLKSPRFEVDCIKSSYILTENLNLQEPITNDVHALLLVEKIFPRIDESRLGNHRFQQDITRHILRILNQNTEGKVIARNISQTFQEGLT